MPWKGLKMSGVGQKDGSQKPQRTDPGRLDHASRTAHSRDKIGSRGSESLTFAQKVPSTSFDNGGRDSTRLADRLLRAQNTKRNRFSLLRFRHASDPQLSASYQEAEAPPIPPIPESAQPPKIITTSPTTDDLDQAAKRKSIFKMSHPKAPHEKIKSVDVNSAMLAKTFQSLKYRGPPRRQDGSHQSLFPAARFSESSRSEASSGDHGVYNSASRTDASSSTSSFLRLLRKNRHSLLFPSLMKNLPGQTFMHDQQPRAISSADQDREHLSPLPSPSRSSVGRGPVEPNTFCNNSTTSAHSRRSSVSNRPNFRGRSSTIGSLADIQDDTRQLSSELVPSSGTSTFTGPRKSFSDLFNPSRSRHNIEGYAAGEVPGTPQSMPSKPNSFSLAREVASCPPREPDDTPATYLTRLEGAVHRAAIATILSQSGDDFYKATLRKYIRGFAFFGDAMDMSIRKLLMEAELPKETQQIDRVLQSFAERYHECNPGIFASPDQAYFIAFSLLILHTDVFNKNNKRKMQKQDYVRNTRGEGLAEEILQCFYDNICYTPFIHVEDEVNLGVRRLAPKARSPLFKTASTDHLSRSSRDPVDPYALILEGKLGSLRPNLKDVMDLEDVYSVSGAGPSPNMNDLHRAFYKPCVLQIVSERSRPDAFLTQSSIANPAESQPGLVDIRVAKVGLLWRKDQKKKKTRSPWQEWGAVLTGSQLYFFKDVQWVKSLISQYESRQTGGRRHPVTFKPPVSDFKPDSIVSTANAVALLDASYKRHKHAFLFVQHGGFEEVLLANSDTDLNDWIATINYAAAFRTTAVRMRGMIGANYEGHLPHKSTRADSVTSDTSETPTILDSAAANTRRMDPCLAEEIFAARRELVSRKVQEADEKLAVTQKQLDDLLQNARHLQILTPIHPRARDNVVLAAGRIAANIKWVRLDIWRARCHRDVLALDLAEEEKHLPSASTTSSINKWSRTGSAKQSLAQKTPTSSVIDTEEERLLREAGILSNELFLQMSASADATDEPNTANNDGRVEPALGEGRSKIRRSLHRTLRDGHFIPHHQRSKKGKDSGTTVSAADDGNDAAETETLARGAGSFTVHGKKASVVTFGSEWENMSPEQRLKQRRPTHTEDSRASEMLGLDLVSSESMSGRQAYSLRSVSTTTAKSLRQLDRAQEKATGLGSPGESLPETSPHLNNENSVTIDADSAVIIEEEEEPPHESVDGVLRSLTAKEQTSIDQPPGKKDLTPTEPEPNIDDSSLLSDRIASE
ncbi:guanyl-nucleotide exchange factor Sec74 [Coccidioides immitis H538.4]|uniref:Guanyl-nucleotide exchange factor Sec74 n=1 Tax=Coccidioides immitis H538.4 TaxID=396776 RepID=A0A0J8RKM0_COCIT|nr:guanyl-nucleotide exchange factor Sec74 [Coccidioides immitis H538.4]